MDEYESLSHTTWDCKYHVVFIPNVGAGRCIRSYGVIWARFSAGLRSSRSRRSKKGT